MKASLKKIHLRIDPYKNTHYPKLFTLIPLPISVTERVVQLNVNISFVLAQPKQVLVVVFDFLAVVCGSSCGRRRSRDLVKVWFAQ